MPWKSYRRVYCGAHCLARPEVPKLQHSATVLQFHAELETPHSVSAPASEPTSAKPTLYSTFLDSRPPSLEVSAIALITRLLDSYPSLRAHIVHLSAADALPLIREAKVHFPI
jgi:allantoinase